MTVRNHPVNKQNYGGIKMNKERSVVNVRYLARGAIIAALYATLTIAFSFLSYGQVQFRIAEGLTVLPFFMPEAVPGLFVGCLVSNFFSPLGLPDIIFGSTATLIGAFLASKIKTWWLVPLPTILSNTIIVGIELYFVFKTPILLNMGYVAIGEIVCCCGIGYLLIGSINKIKPDMKIK